MGFYVSEWESSSANGLKTQGDFFSKKNAQFVKKNLKKSKQTEPVVQMVYITTIILPLAPMAPHQYYFQPSRHSQHMVYNRASTYRHGVQGQDQGL